MIYCMTRDHSSARRIILEHHEVPYGPPHLFVPTGSSLSYFFPNNRRFLVLVEHYKEWATRLTTIKGLETMCKVNQWGYSFKDGYLRMEK